MAQRFIARERFDYPNGAIGWRPGGPFDCLGPYAKVQNCPIADTDIRLTCYATGYADTYFSVPAETRYRGKRIKGYFTLDNGAIEFRPLTDYKPLFHPPHVCAPVQNSNYYGLRPTCYVCGKSLEASCEP